MTPIRMNLLAVLKLAVIPKLKPTVLYAEKLSKAIFKSSISGSKVVIKKIAHPITANDNEMVAKALFTEMSAISLL